MDTRLFYSKGSRCGHQIDKDPHVAQYARTAQLRTTATGLTLTNLYTAKDTPHVKKIHFFLSIMVLLPYKYEATTLS